MSKRIVVNVGLLETRVAVQEGNLLTELYLERHRHRSIVGNVYHLADGEVLYCWNYLGLPE